MPTDTEKKTVPDQEADILEIDEEQLMDIRERGSCNLFMGSKWQNCETEVIAQQTLWACANNLKNRGEAISWASPNCYAGLARCGTNNKAGLYKLIDDEMIVALPYDGDLEPPDDDESTYRWEKEGPDKGKFTVLRVTQRLIDYALSLMPPPPEGEE